MFVFLLLLAGSTSVHALEFTNSLVYYQVREQNEWERSKSKRLLVIFNMLLMLLYISQNK